jgi:hypothetical protein
VRSYQSSGSWCYRPFGGRRPCGSLWRKRFRLCEDARFGQRPQQGKEAAPERLGILRLTRLSVRSTREASYNLPDLQYLVANCSKQISRVSSLGSGTRRYM